MAKRSVNVLIKAKDKASKKFNKIAKSTAGMTSMFKKAAAAAALYFGGRAIKNFAASSLDLYGAQELAVKSLSDALNLLGKGGVVVMDDMKKFASGLQKVTVYGDEATLELMAMGAAMGDLSGKALKDATKAAIGLAKAYKMDTVAAMRLVARAAKGDTASLSRYGIKLAKGLTVQEKFNKVLEIGTRKFQLAKDETDTYVGAMQQMKNAVGDVKEEIGKALAPTVMDTARKIKKWAEENQANVYTWAQKTVAHIVLVKDIFIDFVKYMKTDWVAGLGVAIGAGLKMMVAFGKTVAMITAHAFSVAMEDVVIGPATIKALAVNLARDKYGEWADASPLEQKKYLAESKRLYREDAKKRQEQGWQDVMAESTSILSKTMEVIKVDLPNELQNGIDKSLVKHANSLARINKQLKLPVHTPGGAVTTPAGLLANGSTPPNKAGSFFGSPGRLAARESRLLTIVPGAELSRADKIKISGDVRREKLLARMVAAFEFYDKAGNREGKERILLAATAMA